jgi:Xaa-Pro aminopeptidase
VTQREFAARRARLAATLVEKKLDAFLVSAAPNIRYLTGFTGSNGLVLVATGGTTLFTDPRYAIQAGHETDCRVRVARGSLYAALLALAARKKLKRLAFEKGRLSYEAFEQIQAGMPLNGTLAAAAGWVECERMVKSREEIARIERAVQTNSAAFSKTMRHVKPGVRESEVAAELDYQMRLLGAQGPAFDTLVASGARTALPHAQPTATPIRNNQLLLVDVGASQEGYASDMTRMAFLGRPSARVRRWYQVALEAQQAAIDAVRPGVAAGEVDRAARRVLRAAGIERLFVHSTGHGLGLEIHEPPRLGRREQTPLAEGMVVTVEPGVYREGWGGIRIEDTVVVTRSGVRVLTPTSKELLFL